MATIIHTMYKNNSMNCLQGQINLPVTVSIKFIIALNFIIYLMEISKYQIQFT